MTASTSETPMLPTAAVRRPAARSIEASMSVVVVLPFVPVTTSQGAASGPRSRQASSSSPHTGTPASRAATITGARGGRPGDTTRTSAPSGSVSPSPRRIVAPTTSRIARALALALAVGGVDHRHPGAQVEQLVGCGEPGDADARDDGVDAAPVRPALVPGDVDRRHWRTHSA